MPSDAQPFLGSEALSLGLVRKHELRAAYTALFPDVYVRAGVDVPLAHRARAAWLWSHREGVIAGVTASGLHGAKWVDPSRPVELIWPNARPARGIRTHDYRLRSDEFVDLAGMRVTSRERTAFDIGRGGRLGEAVARLDALGNATSFRVSDVVELADRHRGTRGIRTLRRALDLHDRGAESPQETWLRLLLIDAGFPRPETQIAVRGPDGYSRYFLDMGWEAPMIAVEYDGEHHRVDRPSYRKDIVRSEHLAALRWTLIRVVAGDRPPAIVRRVRAAFNAKLR